jgi:hypothetical protein
MRRASCDEVTGLVKVKERRRRGNLHAQLGAQPDGVSGNDSRHGSSVRALIGGPSKLVQGADRGLGESETLGSPQRCARSCLHVEFRTVGRWRPRCAAATGQGVDDPRPAKSSQCREDLVALKWRRVRNAFGRKKTTVSSTSASCLKALAIASQGARPAMATACQQPTHRAERAVRCSLGTPSFGSGERNRSRPNLCNMSGTCGGGFPRRQSAGTSHPRPPLSNRCGRQLQHPETRMSPARAADSDSPGTMGPEGRQTRGEFILWRTEGFVELRRVLCWRDRTRVEACLPAGLRTETATCNSRLVPCLMSTRLYKRMNTLNQLPFRSRLKNRACVGREYGIEAPLTDDTALCSASCSAAAQIKTLRDWFRGSDLFQVARCVNSQR